MSALVLQVAPATYDVRYSCDCRPHSAETSGTLTATLKPDGDFDVDYPNAGTDHLGFALRAARRVITDSSGLQPSSKWRSSVDVLIQDQTVVVPVSASVVSLDNGIATIEARGNVRDASVLLNYGTIPVSIELDLVEHVKVGRSAEDAPSLTSLVETVNNHFARGVYGLPVDSSVKCELTAK